ncbi:MAG: hypothetical protein J6S60_01460 [Oscillospiraceae bacterium]|nr:hypothetical protein [Oscillospiraceae bacterium]
MERMDEKLFMLRNRKTGAWLYVVSCGIKPAEKNDARHYMEPTLFTDIEYEAYCKIAGISAADYEIVPVRIVEDGSEDGGSGSTHG